MIEIVLNLFDRESKRWKYADKTFQKGSWLDLCTVVWKYIVKRYLMVNAPTKSYCAVYRGEYCVVVRL